MNNLETQSLRLKDGELFIIDQTLLPHEQRWIDVTQPMDMNEAIKSLRVRGAPLIGVAASLCLGLYANQCKSEDDFRQKALMLREARPTAVNLMSNIDSILALKFNPEDIRRKANEIYTADVSLCEAIAHHGASLINNGDQLLTHCNTGGLATAGVGTAFGIILKAHQQNKSIHVYVDETRPLLQGGRLTAWEMNRNEIPHTLICDNMAGHLMSIGKIDKVIVGADRIALNGDFANKVGTYSLAVLCNYHKVPFYVAAPKTTLDRSCLSGESIPIEERRAEEVRGFQKLQWSPKESQVYNPAFDVTPAELVSAWIFEDKVHHQPRSF